MAKAKKTSEKKDIQSLDKVELMNEIRSTEKELYTLHMRHTLGELKQPHLIRKARRTIAQLSTAINSLSI